MTKLRISSTTHTNEVKALLSLRDIGVTSKFSHFTSLGSGAWEKQVMCVTAIKKGARFIMPRLTCSRPEICKTSDRSLHSVRRRCNVYRIYPEKQSAARDHGRGLAFTLSLSAWQVVRSSNDALSAPRKKRLCRGSRRALSYG